jgi:Pentapeptide repeats (8 copies)
VAEPQQPWQVLRRWREGWPRWLLRTAGLVVLAVLGGVVWRWWGLAGLAIACGIALVGRLIVSAVVTADRHAPLLREPDLDGVKGKDRLEAIDARTRLHHDLRNGPLQRLTVLAALAVAVVGFQQLAEDRHQASQDRQLTRQGQASERFTRAIDQLGSDRVETRIGGIHGLDQIAEQSPENSGPVGEVLLAWLNGRPRPNTPPDTLLREHAPDVQAALSVLTRQQRYSSIVNRLDLHWLGLGGASLPGADLHGADLLAADLGDADLRDANLASADLRDADLASADLRGADLRDANLSGAKIDESTRGPSGFDWHRAGAEVDAPYAP